MRVYDIVSHYFLKNRRVKLVIALKHSHDGFHRSNISKNFHFDDDIVSHYFLKNRRVKLAIALKHSHDGFHRSKVSKNFHFDIE